MVTMGNADYDYAHTRFKDIIKSHDRDIQAIAKEILKSSNQKFWDGMSILLKRPWFTRLWVMQEYILPAKPIFQCGQNKFVPNDLVLFWKVLAVDTKTLQMNGTKNRLDVMRLSPEANTAKRNWQQMGEGRRLMQRNGFLFCLRHCYKIGYNSSQILGIEYMVFSDLSLQMSRNVSRSITI